MIIEANVPKCRFRVGMHECAIQAESMRRQLFPTLCLAFRELKNVRSSPAVNKTMHLDLSQLFSRRYMSILPLAAFSFQSR
mmetsp:Transcript_1424/g.2679  ORF Transcript_1424/g.2679 Transcript_1424/m.2679 type:complete len:81 (+) Transcript_1424:52-294(+)